MAIEEEPTRRSEKLICPDCGIEMNRHAAKLIEPRSVVEAAQVDPVLGGIVQEVHCCPRCGGSKGRRRT